MKTKRDFSFNTRLLSEKSKKNLEIFEVMRKKGVVSRLDISNITGINTVSVSNYMKNYISQNLVLERGFDVSTGGRKPELVELNLKGNYVIGLSINKTFDIMTTLTDLAINALEKKKAPAAGTGQTLTSRTIAAIEDIMKSPNIEQNKIKAIGIGIANPDQLSVEEIKDKFGIETFAGAGEICAASAENRLNPASQGGGLLYMYSDSGAGVLIKDEIYINSEDENEDDIHSEGIKYLSPWDKSIGMVEASRREIQKGVGTKIVELTKGNVDNLTEKTVIAAADEKDEVALDILERVGMNLGLRTAYLINLFGPKIVVIGGGTEDAGELVLAPVKKVVKKMSLNKYSDVRIVAGILGEEAVSLGAACLAIREILLKA